MGFFRSLGLRGVGLDRSYEVDQDVQHDIYSDISLKSVSMLYSFIILEGMHPIGRFLLDLAEDLPSDGLTMIIKSIYVCNYDHDMTLSGSESRNSRRKIKTSLARLIRDGCDGPN